MAAYHEDLLVETHLHLAKVCAITDRLLAIGCYGYHRNWSRKVTGDKQNNITLMLETGRLLLICIEHTTYGTMLTGLLKHMVA